MLDYLSTSHPTPQQICYVPSKFFKNYKHYRWELIASMAFWVCLFIYLFVCLFVCLFASLFLFLVSFPGEFLTFYYLVVFITQITKNTQDRVIVHYNMCSRAVKGIYGMKPSKLYHSKAFTLDAGGVGGWGGLGTCSPKNILGFDSLKRHFLRSWDWKSAWD